MVPLDSAPAVEVKSGKAVPVDVQAIEAQPLHGQEVAALKPPEPTLATSSLQGVSVSPAPQVAELMPSAGGAPTAPAQVTALAPVAAGTQLPVDPTPQGSLPPLGQRVAESTPPAEQAPAVPPGQVAESAPVAAGMQLPVDPPLQGSLPPLGQQVAESEPLQVRPAASAGVMQPEREPPSRPLSSEQVARSKALEASPTATAEVAQPVPEAPTPKPLAPAIGPPSEMPFLEPLMAELDPVELKPASGGAVQPEREPPSRPLSSGQMTESKALVARPIDPAELARPANEAPRPDPFALAIDTPNQPFSSKPQVPELVPLEAPQVAAPVPVGPPVHEVPMAESSAAASSSPSQGTVLSSEQVAKLEPYSPTAGPSQGEGPIIAGRIGKIVRYVEQYDGGRCFFVAPVAVTETEAKLEGYGASAGPFEALDSAFRHENGFEASIDVRLVNPTQCPAVTFLGRLRGTNTPRLHIDAVTLGPGEVLTGTVDGFGGRNVELLVATDAGTVQNVSHLLKPGTDARTFKIGRSDIAWASGGQPQLLIVVASLLPLKSLRFDRPVAADRVFPAALGEAEMTNQPVAAMARYFKLER